LICYSPKPWKTKVKTMTASKTQVVVAVAVNLAVAQLVATWLGFPRWAGTVAASGVMVAASAPDKLPEPIQQVVKVAVLPGNVAANLVEEKQAIEGCNCADTHK